MLDVIEVLTVTERDTLAQHEAVIQRGLNTFVEVGAALLAIRDGKLYRSEFGTFEEYCRDKWGWERRHAYRLMDAAQAVENVSHGTQIIPTSERQIRPLTSLAPEQQREAWARAVQTAPDDKVTASHVERVVAEMNGNGRQPYTHISDDSYEWYTPAEYINAARIVMGAIDLDPASCAEAQETIKARRFYTKGDDGLSQDWRGRVWLNPPYCMPDVEQFVDRAIDLHSKGHVKQAIILTNNSTDTAWFHRLLAYSGIVCLTKGRVKFWGPDGGAANGARQGQALFYIGDNVDKFIEKFREFGAIVRLI